MSQDRLLQAPDNVINRLMADMAIRGNNGVLLAHFDAGRKNKKFTHPHTFLHFGSYFLLTGRKGWTLIEDAQSGAEFMVCKSPHDGRDLIYPEPTSVDKGYLTAQWLHAQPTLPKNGLQLVCHTSEEADGILQWFERIQGGDPAKILRLEPMDEMIMDSYYPIHILDTVKTAAYKGPEFEPVRNKANKWGNLEDVKILPLKEYPVNYLASLMMASLQQWTAGKMLRNKAEQDTFSEFYNYIIQLVQKSPKRLDGFVTTLKTLPIGFTIWEADVENKIAIGLAALTSYPMPGLAEFQMVTACRHLAELGIDSYNIGGSEYAKDEKKSLNPFKEKFMPRESLKVDSWNVSIEILRGGMKQTVNSGYAPEMLL